ncbi:ribonuclease P protein subunit p30 isoform X3 [Crotalus tigris]|uniref:ribonuclease P protein subunit p30 isoform X3 n=1 Tax=Crotalus tigris TaxID=88082 RepID=UPI00192F6DB8|nr:ribonuclease P protein subunit p30 isoform X3 [Crotalus tigris]
MQSILKAQVLFSFCSCWSPRGWKMAAFADLNILYLPEKEALQKLVEAAAHREFIDAFYKGEGGWVGYSAVAINYIVNYEEKKKEIVKPITPAELFPSLPLVQGKSKPIKILSRLTLVVSDPSHCNVLRATSTNIKYYDIFAVFPKNAKLFHVACTTLDVDLVCVDVTEKLPFFIKRPSVNVAIERGIYFELIYVPAIKDSTMRRYTISNACSLMQICRGKNIILSSGAEKPIQLRSPYDVANLGWLFGLSESNGKATVSTNSRAVLLHGGNWEKT